MVGQRQGGQAEMNQRIIGGISRLALAVAGIAAALGKGLRTADIKSEGATIVSTREMGDAIISELEKAAGR